MPNESLPFYCPAYFCNLLSCKDAYYKKSIYNPSSLNQNTLQNAITESVPVNVALVKWNPTSKTSAIHSSTISWLVIFLKVCKFLVIFGYMTQRTLLTAINSPPRTVLFPRKQNPVVSIQHIFSPNKRFTGAFITIDIVTVMTKNMLTQAWKVCIKRSEIFMETEKTFY